MRNYTHNLAQNTLNAALVQPDPTLALIGYVGSGDMARDFPEIQQMVEFKTEGPSKHLWGHVLQVVKKVPHDNLVLRWAAMFHDVGKPATFREEDGEVTFHGHEAVGEKIWYRVADRVGVGDDFKEQVGLLIRMHIQFAAMAGAWKPHSDPDNNSPGLTDRGIRRFLRKVGDQYENLYALTIADISTSKEWRVLASRKRCAKLKERIDKLIEDDKKVVPKLPKGTGHRLYDSLGLKGPELGRIMSILNKRVLAGEEITLDNVAYKAALILQEEKDA